MTPFHHSLYTVCLLLALSCLLKWSERRQRREIRFRQALSATLIDGAAERQS